MARPHVIFESIMASEGNHGKRKLVFVGVPPEQSVIANQCAHQSADWFAMTDSFGRKATNTNLFGSRIFQSIVISASCALVECRQGEGMLKHTNFFIGAICFLRRIVNVIFRKHEHNGTESGRIRRKRGTSGVFPGEWIDI